MLLDQEDVILIHMGKNCLVALGSNQEWEGDTPADLVLRSISELVKYDLKIIKASRLFKTPSFPKGAGPDFVNAALMINTKIAPDQLLLIFHELEANSGRVRQKRWGSRTLDMDLLSYGDLVLPDQCTFKKWRSLDADMQQRCVPEHLILPHPRLQERAFVLGPLMDVAPEWRHPALEKTVEEMFFSLPVSQRDELEVMSLK